MAVGTLSDNEILKLVEDNKLIIENFDSSNIKQACYELRASNIYHDISAGNKKVIIQGDDYILIKPKQLIVIITEERLCLPDDILGRILTKGKLFSLGLLPVNTYADPGFKGKLGIVFHNFSNSYLKIKPKDRIAKIEFSKLSEPVLAGYVGQHNYESEVWPINNEMILSEEEIKLDRRIKSPREEIRASYGDYIGSTVDLVNKYSRRLMITSVTYISLSMILIFIISKTQIEISNFMAIILGLVSNLLFGVSTLFWTKINGGK